MSKSSTFLVCHISSFYVYAMIIRNNLVIKCGFNTSLSRMETTWWPLGALFVTMFREKTPWWLVLGCLSTFWFKGEAIGGH
jgi:hypothetical protein